VGVDPAAHVDASACIVAPVRLAAGAVVEAGAVVGPWVVVSGGGRVSPGAQVVRSVVWPGATAQGNLTGTILAPENPFLAETTPPPQTV
jgi:UDP-3-O-[3-hydroxymyristoyl] glucosamine N-acyltransferase